jgi:superfamily II DNA or RNA helicase
MITIKRAGNLLEISDATLVSLLDEPLSYSHRVTYFGEKLMERLQYKREHPQERSFQPAFEFVKRTMYQVKDGRIYCAAGLKSRVFKSLSGYGLEYTYSDLRTNLLPAANYDRLSDLGEISFKYKQDQVLTTIDSCDGGIIVAPTGYGKTFILMLLLKLYPKSKIVVVSPGLDLLKSTYERLLSVCPDIGRIGGGKSELGYRVTLCSADSLHKADLEAAQLIIYDEVHSAGTDSRIKDLSRFTNAKFIGFSALFPARSDGADDMVEALFGPVLLRIHYDDAARNNAVTPIKVLMINVPPEDGVSYPYRSPVAWARHVYWRNDYRNGIIAKAVSKIPQWLGVQDPQVLVMVDKLDHAYELRKKIPDYEIVYASKSDEFHNQLVKRKLAKDDEEGMDF